jgi:hypothetical protein
MRKRLLGFWLFVFAFAMHACTLALDFDALQDPPKEQESDNNAPVETCDGDKGCDDGIDCTTDKCNSAHRCVHDPNNEACPGFEVCRRDEGCVDVGRECLLDSDCDDNIDCTTDYCNSDGICHHRTDDDRCNNLGNLCIEGMTCDSELGCVGGMEKSCEQAEGPSCYNTFCNPENGECDLEEPKPGADDDGDEYCDDLEIFGGNDCEDDDETIYPGADEVCNRLDNNCDDLVDGTVAASALSLASGETLSSPSVAFGNGRYVVAWQTGEADEAAVKVQLLGEGACIAETDCADAELTAASQVFDLTERGGDGGGAMPIVAYAGEKFHIVWVATADGEDHRVVRTAFAVQSDNTVVFDDGADTFSGDDVAQVSSLAVSVTADTLVAAFGVGFSDGTYGVQLKPDSAERLTGARDADAVENVSLACADDCVLAYDKMADSDLEVFEGLVRLGSTPAFQDGWPVQISLSSAQTGDPSSAPSVTWASESSWVVSFIDVAVSTDDTDAFEPDSDIRGVVGDGGDGVLDLVTDSIGDHQQATIVFDGDRFSLLVVNDVQGEVTLRAVLFESDLSPVGNQRTELDQLQGGTLIPGPLVWTGDHLAAVWISSPENGDGTLRFLSFETCTPDSK